MGTLDYTRTCIEWCAQSIAHYEYRTLILIYTAIILLIIYILFKDKHKIINAIPYAILVLIIGFCISNEIEEERHVNDEIKNVISRSNTSRICPIGTPITECQDFFVNKENQLLKIEQK